MTAIDAMERWNFKNLYTGRRRHIPLQDLILQRELEVCEEKNLNSYLCPCRKCHGGHRYAIRIVQRHLREYQRDPFLMKSMVGGDPEGGFPEGGIWIRDQPEPVPEMNVFDDADMHAEYRDHLDPYHDIQQQLHDAFDLGDRLREETPHVFEAGAQQDDENNEEMPDLDNLDTLYREGTKPVYEGSNVSTISASIVLINMAVIHNVSNAYVDELLKYLSTVLLPQGNCLPKSHYEGKRMIKKLGLNYNIIHTCPEGCVLYRGEYENLDACPKEGCGRSRYIEGSDNIPARVIRHFPLIPRLLRMFRSPTISGLMKFHSDHPNTNPGVMKSVADSPAWKHIDNDVDVAFGRDARNLRLGMALDGVNPFPHTNTTHSTWPVIMFLYNLPPYLVTKKFFIQLCILISGKMSPTNENMDVFIRPLVEELQRLWGGVNAQDFSKPPGERRFLLRGILMWVFSDYPAYGLISGLCTHGHKGCTVCGPETEARTAKSGNKVNADGKVKGRKTVYSGARRWTHRQHPYRRNLEFNGNAELRSPPRPMTGEETARCGREREEFLRNGGRKNSRDDPVHEHGVKRHSCLDELPYWQVRGVPESFLFF